MGCPFPLLIAGPALMHFRMTLAMNSTSNCVTLSWYPWCFRMNFCFLLNFCAAVCEYFRKISTAEKSPLSPITSTFVKIYSISLKSGTLPSGGFFPVFFSTFYIFIFNFHKMWNTDQICESLFNFVQTRHCAIQGDSTPAVAHFSNKLFIFSQVFLKWR